MYGVSNLHFDLSRELHNLCNIMFMLLSIDPMLWYLSIPVQQPHLNVTGEPAGNTEACPEEQSTFIHHGWASHHMRSRSSSLSQSVVTRYC